MEQLPKPLIELKAITKDFPGVRALDAVDFQLFAGEVQVLFGENGAGKSTLISILSGVYPQTSGQIEMDGESVHFHSVHDAAKAGIGTVFQEFSLVPTLRVFENVFLGREKKKGLFIDKSAMIAEAELLFAELGFEIDVRRRVSTLSRAEQQMVEISKAFLVKARVLILDEPTASLSERETENLFRFIAKAKSEGVGIIYISHRIQEFRAIADRITILRDGRLIGTVSARDTSETELVRLMTGRSVDQIHPDIARNQAGAPLASFENITTSGVHGISLDIHRGEVLGIAGLVGSGKSRLFRALLGLQRINSGKIILNGRDVTGFATRKILSEGVFYLPSDRKSEGLQLSASTRQNIALPLLDKAGAHGRSGFLSPGKIRKEADLVAERVDLSPSYLDRIVSKLSGGNQQKTLFGKGFAKDHALYIFDEPTVGVDMGTKIALYQLIREIAESGKAIIVISSDLPEVMNLAHRLIIFSKGRIAAELTGSDITEEKILKYFFAETRLAS